MLRAGIRFFSGLKSQVPSLKSMVLKLETWDLRLETSNLYVLDRAHELRQSIFRVAIEHARHFFEKKRVLQA